MATLKTKINGEWVQVGVGAQGPQGPAGEGSGDMETSVYDPQGKAQDVFKYADDKVAAITVPVQSVNGKTGAVQIGAADVGAPSVSEAQGYANTAETNAKAYTNEKIAAIPTPDVSGQIQTHNTAIDSHSDIRLEVSAARNTANTAQREAAAAQAAIENLSVGAENVSVPDATAAALGLEGGASVDDALGKLSGAVLKQDVGKYTKVENYGALPVGTTVKINVGGVATDFIVVHQGNPDTTMYAESCNGTWLLMKGAYGSRMWDSTSNSYPNSDIHAYLNSDFLALLDENVRTHIKTVKIPYASDDVFNDGIIWSGENGVEAKVFLLGARELNTTGVYVPVDGAALDYFTAGGSKIVYQDGKAITWWLRTRYGGNNTTQVCIVNSLGNVSNTTNVTASTNVRPVFIMDSSASAEFYTDGENYYTEQEYKSDFTDTHNNSIIGPLVEALGGAKVATGSYTGTGTYGSSNPNFLTFDFVPKFVWIAQNGYRNYPAIFIRPDTYTEFKAGYINISGTAITSSTSYMCMVDGNTLYWYSTNSSYGANWQANAAGTTYDYIAIG